MRKPRTGPSAAHARPGAHVLIAMIAAAAHTFAGDTASAAFWAENVRERQRHTHSRGFFSGVSDEIGPDASAS